MSGRMPDRIPEYMSDRMSEYFKRPDTSWWGSREVKSLFTQTHGKKPFEWGLFSDVPMELPQIGHLQTFEHPKRSARFR